MNNIITNPTQKEFNEAMDVVKDYLRINNPHKTSLYLACGIPIITWNKAAIAQYVRKKLG